MAERLLPPRYHWRLVVAAPAREVFASMEQMCGIPPFRFEVLGDDTARVVEFERKGLISGGWRRLARLDGEGAQRASTDGIPEWRTAVRWMRCEARPVDLGTEMLVGCSGGRGALERALQLVRLLSAGEDDR